MRMTEAEYQNLMILKKSENARPKKIVSELEEDLSFKMVHANLPVFQRQYKFHPERNWKLDFYYAGWGIEVQGGGWVEGGGGHNRNALVMAKDYEKFNACHEIGIKLLLFTGEQVKDGRAIQQLNKIFKEAL